MIRRYLGLVAVNSTYTRWVKFTWFAALLSATAGGSVPAAIETKRYSNPRCTLALTATQKPDMDVVWQRLRVERLLIDNTSRIGGCGPACVVNVIQGIALKAGKAPLAEPNLILSDLLSSSLVGSEGGTSAAALVTFLENIQRKYFPEIQIDISAIAVGDPDFEYAGRHNHLAMVSTIRDDNLMPGEHSLKLLLGMLINMDGTVGSGHAQIIEAYDNKTLTILDPTRPQNPITASREEDVEVNGAKVPSFRFAPKQGIVYRGLAPLAVLTIKIAPSK